MTIFNLGSINVDNVFEMEHMPQPGETLTANRFTRGLGGKGANQSVAVARAGGVVRHIGLIGPDGLWMRDALSAFGVDVSGISLKEDGTSGQAIIYVDQSGENSIVLEPGTNRQISLDHVSSVLKDATKDDCLVLQNETNMAAEAVQHARQKGIKIAYSAAPFEAEAVETILQDIDILAVNEVEMQQLNAALPHRANDIAKLDLLVTQGTKGAKFINGSKDGTDYQVPAFQVDSIDTTGAGDTFFGFFIHHLMSGETPGAAMKIAAAASALQVMKIGASDAIPTRTAVLEFLSQNDG